MLVCTIMIDIIWIYVYVFWTFESESWSGSVVHSVVANSATPWTVHEVLQARIPTLGDLPDPGVKFRSPALLADSLPSEPSEKPLNIWVKSQIDNILSPLPFTDALRKYTKMLTVVISEWWDYRWFYVCPYPLLHAILTFIHVLLCNIKSYKIYLKDNRVQKAGMLSQKAGEGRPGSGFALCDLGITSSLWAPGDRDLTVVSDRCWSLLILKGLFECSGGDSSD